MISENDIRRIQEQLGRLALEAVRIDLDGFIEASDLVGSPQALSAGVSPSAVTSAGQWAEMARLLKPFRDHAVERLAIIRSELAEDDEGLVPREAACPQCRERRVDELAINEDESVLCATCGRRYQLPTRAKWLTPIPGQRGQRLTKHFAFALKPDTARALLLFLHEIERERGQRTTWDEAFKRLLTAAGRPVEESRE